MKNPQLPPKILINCRVDESIISIFSQVTRIFHTNFEESNKIAQSGIWYTSIVDYILEMTNGCNEMQSLGISTVYKHIGTRF
jgi:hypothetical protein